MNKNHKLQILNNNKKKEIRLLLDLMSYLFNHQIKFKSLKAIQKKHKLKEKQGTKKKWKK